MEMKDFAAKVCGSVRAELGSRYRVDVKEVRKNNGVVLHGLTITAKGENVAPTIYLEGFLEAYEYGIPFKGIAEEILDAYRRSEPDKGVDIGFFRSFEAVRDRICYKLIGRKGNEELLKDIPYIDFLDLAICFYYAYQGESLGEGSILIHNSHMEMWESCMAELFGLAKRNTPKLCPWRCCSLDEALAEVEEESTGEPAEEPGFELPLKVLSNTKRLYGAACILYPGVLETLAQELGGGFLILPSSIHEVLLLPNDMMIVEPKEFRQMIEEVNSTCVLPEEVLSDSLYYYDMADRRVRVV